MRQLYLVRHGIAVPPGTPGYEDDERPLTSRGERRMRQNARGLRRLGVTVSRLLASPLPRALRTAEIVAEVLGLTDVLEQADVLGAGVEAWSIQEWLTSREEETLMLVGHDPAISALVGRLTVGEAGEDLCSLRKGAVAALVAPEGDDYQVEWLATPRLLRHYGR